MVLEKIGSSINDSIKKLLKLAVVDEAAVKELVKDIQRALLQGDVNVKLVFDLSKRIEDRALKETLPPGISRREHVVKVVYDELTRFLGEKTAKTPIVEGRTNIIMLVGIQGSGKTTSIVKIARFLKKRGLKVAIVGADTYRPGALAQLKQLASTAGIPLYGEEGGKDSVALARRGVEFFRETRPDAILIDTAGRHKEEAQLIEEMKGMASAVPPDHIIMVIDGTIGQQAALQAQAFHQATRLGSILVSKLDGSARGGGALSAVAATGAPIIFVGTGEKTEDLELFDPPRFVGRLLGMGDIGGLVAKVKEAEIEVPEAKVKAFMTGKFTLTDMYEQIDNLRKLGPFGKILKMIPGMSYDLPDSAIQMTEERLKGWRSILGSMTKEEKTDPKILNASRIRRIARGSGRKERDVKELIQQYDLMKKMVKSLARRRLPFKSFDKKMMKDLQG